MMESIAAAAPAEEIRRTVEEVFQRPEFRAQDHSAWLAVLQRIAEFFGWLGTLYSALPVLFWIFLIGCLGLLALMLLLIVTQVRRAFGRPGAQTASKSAAAGERLRRSADFRRCAAECAERGEYTEAVRCLFLALVYRFDESGRVGFRKAYTNREYLALVSDRHETHDRLRLFVDAIDDHWYAQRSTDRSLYDACLTQYDRLAS